MSDVIKAKCTDCGMQTEINFETRKFGRGLEETYFKCGVCSVHTTCYITNAKVRKLIKEVATLREGRDRTELVLAQMERKQANIDATMDELKTKFGR